MFSSLPPELQVYIFSMLDLNSLRSVFQVNKRFYQSASSPVIWRSKLLPQYAQQENAKEMFAKNFSARLPQYIPYCQAVLDALKNPQLSDRERERLTSKNINKLIELQLMTVSEALELANNSKRFYILTETCYQNIHQRIFARELDWHDVVALSLEGLDILEQRSHIRVNEWGKRSTDEETEYEHESKKRCTAKNS